jgi:uncharacterized protein YutE (UPF0331/DUF86 family)
MTELIIEKDIVIKRIEGIESELSELKKLSRIPFDEFSAGDGWKLAQFHLHRALEGVFNIGSHILSRIPGGQATQYREMALKMGEYKIVPKEFAETKLVSMAKYRNRLVHFYAEILPKELHEILQSDLPDFEAFLSSVKNVLIKPEQYGLRAV